MPEIDSLFIRPGRDLISLNFGDRYPNRIEEDFRQDVESKPTQSFSQQQREAVYTLGDPTQPVRPVVHRIHGGHDGQQDLSRADITGGLLPSNVLLPRLKRKPDGWFAGHIF